MINYVKNFISEFNLAGKTILVGFSGGIDSSCLLDILSKIDDIKVIGIHLNHNWRGEESKRDEDFAYNFAKKRNVEFYTEKLDPDTKKTETNAREERYAFFERCLKKLNGDAVFLAHNKNDNVETLIYRLIKGTGPSGLNSIPRTRDFYYRPLLNFSREEIENYIKENNLEFILDSSNLNTKYKRNLIREEIIPLMKKINPEVINSISNFIEINKMSQEIINDTLSKAKKSIIEDNKINRRKFLNLTKPVQFEIINELLKGKLKTRDYKTIKKAVSFIKENDSSKLSVNNNLFLKIYDNKIYLTENKQTKTDAEISLKEGENNFNGYKITVEKTEIPAIFPNKESLIQYVKLDFNNDYKIRARAKGDEIQPFGSNDKQKLKTFFIKKKIPSELRYELPLIALNNEVLFVPKITINEKVKVKKEDKFCYKITVKKGN